MKIRSIVAAGLMGETPKGGWSAEIEPAELGPYADCGAY